MMRDCRQITEEKDIIKVYGNITVSCVDCHLQVRVDGECVEMARSKKFPD